MSEKWSQLGHTLWSEATPIDGTLAEVYLNDRGIRLAPWPAALRFHPAADHPKLKQKFPALIAHVIGAAEASFQFTYLSADGKGKAAIDKEDQRRTLGSNKGGVVLLTDDIQPGATLLVGEGVESVASAMQASGLPGVAVLGIGGLASVEFSPDVVEIVVLAENDDASRKAIDKVAPSLTEKGVKVRVAQPPQGFGDFNDLIDPSKEGGGPGGLVIARMIIAAAPEWQPKRGKGAKPAAPKQASQASFLVDLAASRCDLFCDPTGEAYASFVAAHGQGEHRENSPPAVEKLQPLASASLLRREKRRAVLRGHGIGGQDADGEGAFRRRSAQHLPAHSAARRQDLSRHVRSGLAGDRD